MSVAEPLLDELAEQLRGCLNFALFYGSCEIELSVLVVNKQL